MNSSIALPKAAKEVYPYQCCCHASPACYFGVHFSVPFARNSLTVTVGRQRKQRSDTAVSSFFFFKTNPTNFVISAEEKLRLSAEVKLEEQHSVFLHVSGVSLFF